MLALALVKTLAKALALAKTSFSALAKELEKASVLDLTKCVSPSAYVAVLLVLCIVSPVLQSVSFLALKYKKLKYFIISASPVKKLFFKSVGLSKYLFK